MDANKTRTKTPIGFALSTIRGELLWREKERERKEKERKKRQREKEREIERE